MGVRIKKYKSTLITAIDNRNCGIGFEGKLPWKIKSDMVYFKSTTCKIYNKKDPKAKNVLICGSATYESFSKPLPGRHTIVVTSNPNKYVEELVTMDNNILHISTDWIFVRQSVDNVCLMFVKPTKVYDALKYLENNLLLGKIFIIGGGATYKSFLNGSIENVVINKALITLVDARKILPNNNYVEYDSYFSYEYINKNFKYYNSMKLEPGVTAATYTLS